MTTSSSPGKIILFGEHAVVYGFPALAVPVTQVQATATVDVNPGSGIRIEAPDIGISAELSDLPINQPLAAAVSAVFSTLSVSHPAPCTIHIQSSIPVASGLGSGAAVSVSIIRALSEYLGKPLPDDRVNNLAFEIEKLHHGTPSGIDNSVITYAHPVFFRKGFPMHILRVGAEFTIVIGDTGISASTRQSVAAVRELHVKDSTHWDAVFRQVGEIADNARQAVERGDVSVLGELMDANHALLQKMTVSCPELDRLVDAARQSGALGAKLSGGGRGGNMIALVVNDHAQQVARSLSSAGAVRTIITTLQPTQGRWV
jgi:mevalonate kinase